ncbi:MAG: hypothetical protein WCX79_04570 [Candidatus Paceibacterota bacterium]|jgi:Tfp pilus assembly PilM family ATPase
MFKKTSIGISFSDEAIHFVKLSKKLFGRFVLLDYGEKKLSERAIQYGIVKDQEELQRVLQLLKQEKKIKSAFVSLPEEKENLSFDYLNDYKEVLKNARIRIKNFEAEGEAERRAVIKNKDVDAYMIVNIEKFHTGVFIVADEKVVFSSTINIGGETIYKITEESDIGLIRNIVIKEVSSATLSGISILKEEINRHLLRWHTRIGEKDPKRPLIKKIILTGSDVYLQGVDEYLSVTLKIIVEYGNVWTNIFNPREVIPSLSFKESLSFASAIGTALKRFE